MMRRRAFLGGAPAALAAPARAWQEAARPLRAALIGLGGRGQDLLKRTVRHSMAQINAVCDVYEPNLEAGLSAAGNRARAFRDYRRLLEDRDIEAVIIATPEHWHFQMVMDAIAAGKDIYVEKPLCQTPEQGVKLVDAERGSKSVIQVGMQRRSFDLYQQGRDIVQRGELGTVRMVRSWWINTGVNPAAGTFKGPIDWKQWQGGASDRPAPDPVRFHNWRYFSEYSGGIVADQGAHAFDGIHMIMNAGYPSAVTAAAGRVHKQGVDLPESVVVTAEYPEDFIATFSVNYAAMRYQGRNDQLNHFDGDKARMDIGRVSIQITRQGEDPQATMVRDNADFGAATDAHLRNFYECVRTRARPHAPIEKGFHAALVVQMANLSLKHGRRIRWDMAQRRVVV